MRGSRYVTTSYVSELESDRRLVNKNFCLAASVIRHFTPIRSVYNEITNIRHQQYSHCLYRF